MTPEFAPLLTVAAALAASGVEFALGGSGLLYSLALVDQVRDWDLTTDAPFGVVREAIGRFTWREAPHGDGSFASSYRLTIVTDGPEVDLMGRFAIRTDAGVCHLPTVVCATWHGIPVGSPEVWAVAYRLMSRHEKADLLADYLRRNGSRAGLVARLLAEPLPDAVRADVFAWSSW